MMNNTLDEPRIVLIDPADVIATDVANPAEREDIGLLMASLKETGQKMPVLLARHPDIDGKYLYVDGHGRGYCLGILGKPMMAIILDGQPSESERIILKFSTNAIRRAMSLEEIAADTTRFLEITGATQLEAAALLKCSETTISRAMTLMRRIPAEHRTATRELGPYFVSLIAPLRDPAKIEAAIAFAQSSTPDGRKQTRAAVTDYVAALRDGKKPAAASKPKRLKFTLDGRAYEVELRPDDTPATLLAAFKAVAKRIDSNGKKPIEVVITDLVHGDRAAAPPATAPAKRPAVTEQPALANP